MLTCMPTGADGNAKNIGIMTESGEKDGGIIEGLEPVSRIRNKTLSKRNCNRMTKLFLVNFFLVRKEGLGYKGLRTNNLNKRIWHMARTVRGELVEP
jgi:hypothetical protein